MADKKIPVNSKDKQKSSWLSPCFTQS